MPALKTPAAPKLPKRPPITPGATLETRVKILEKYANDIQTWAEAVSRSYAAFTKQVVDLFNRGSVKRLDQ